MLQLFHSMFIPMIQITLLSHNILRLILSLILIPLDFTVVLYLTLTLTPPLTIVITAAVSKQAGALAVGSLDLTHIDASISNLLRSFTEIVLAVCWRCRCLRDLADVSSTSLQLICFVMLVMSITVGTIHTMIILFKATTFVLMDNVIFLSSWIAAMILNRLFTTAMMT